MSELWNAFVYYSNEYGWILVPVFIIAIYRTTTAAGVYTAGRLGQLKQ